MTTTITKNDPVAEAEKVARAQKREERDARKAENPGPIDDWDKNTQGTSLRKDFEFANDEDAAAFARHAITLATRMTQQITVSYGGGADVAVELPFDGKPDRSVRVIARRLKNAAAGKAEDDGAEADSED